MSTCLGCPLIDHRSVLISQSETCTRKTDTISYEVLCGVSRRVPRVYLEHGKIVDVEDWILEA